MVPSSSRRPCRAASNRRTWRCQPAIAVALILAIAHPALAADVDVVRAERLVQEGKYQEAYDLLAPFEESARADAAFDALIGQAALRTSRPHEAQKFFERSLAASPSAPEAHLGLGRAYLALSDYASAKIEFETVLRFDDLPANLHQQAEIYAAAAQGYAAGRRLLPFGYAAVGVGNYRVNPNSGTDAFGGSDTNDGFFSGRIGGGLNYLLPGDYALAASLDFRGRVYGNDNRRHDADWRWNAAASRTFGEHNLALGLRGRVSYRGNGIYRNDWGVYGDWRFRLDQRNQITAGMEFRQRLYPAGPLQARSRNIVEATTGWTHSMLDGKASFTLAGQIGGEFATQGRPDGNSFFFGLSPTLNFTLTESVGFFVTFWWQNDRYNVEQFNVGPGDEVLGIATRNDNLYEAGAGFTWEFARGWSFNPEVLYIRDKSNILALNYSSTEVWITLRWDL